MGPGHVSTRTCQFYVFLYIPGEAKDYCTVVLSVSKMKFCVFSATEGCMRPAGVITYLAFLGLRFRLCNV